MAGYPCDHRDTRVDHVQFDQHQRPGTSNGICRAQSAWLPPNQILAMVLSEALLVGAASGLLGALGLVCLQPTARRSEVSDLTYSCFLYSRNCPHLGIAGGNAYGSGRKRATGVVGT